MALPNESDRFRMHGLGILPCRAAVLEVVEPTAEDHRFEEEGRAAPDEPMVEPEKLGADRGAPYDRLGDPPRVDAGPLGALIPLLHFVRPSVVIDRHGGA